MGASFFADMSIVIAVAAAVGLIFSRFNLPMTVGYILAGIIVGPNIPPALISNKENIQMLSDLGVMFLMFSIGLGFSFRRVRKMGGTVVFPALWDVALMVVGGFVLGKMLGWSALEGFILGLILCDSSTSIAAKTLDELGWLGKRFADNTFAIALIEDVLAILLIAVLNGVGGGEGGDFWTMATVVIKQLAVLSLFLVGVIVFGILFVPKLMNYVTEHFSDEIVLMVALGICFSVSCLAQNVLNLSLVVGAFLAGAILSEARAKRRIERAVNPVTNLFAAVFFISVGLMVEPIALWDNAAVILLITVVMIGLKLVNNTVACILMGETPRDAFKVGIGMGQVAEFAFIIAGIAMTSGLSDRPLYQIAVGVALLCTATNPYLLRASDRLYNVTSHAFGAHAHAILRWYRHWSISLRANRTNGIIVAIHIRNHIILLGVNFAIIAILFAGVYVVARIPVVTELLRQLDRFWQPFSYEISWGGILCTGTALLLSAPALWAAQHTWAEIARHVADDAFVSARQLRKVRHFIKFTLRVVGFAVIVIYTALLCTGFLHNRWILIAILLSAIVFVARSSKRFRKGYVESYETLSRAFDVNILPSEDPLTIDSLIKVHTETIVIPNGSAVVGKTLAELDLRRVTGVSVISIYGRSTRAQISPGAETRLSAGDYVIIVGSDEELSKAISLLTGK